MGGTSGFDVDISGADDFARAPPAREAGSPHREEGPERISRSS